MASSLADEFASETPLFAAERITSMLARPSVPDGELERLFADPRAQEAIVLASPMLFDQVRRLLAGIFTFQTIGGPSIPWIRKGMRRLRTICS